ncbi:prepilin-type N-terminal cleavage/methylation domain-containing protein [Bradyrhizobium sp. AZCC 1678]|uniref:prepilin-type N-terminal cleavage/methylation domain-containing protein n=1 Tax=Bradyrhizobium sp. AZCC 1678 TaxID=3117030 RepID=UPI002FF04479
MTQDNRRDGQAGFTLVELLIALAVTAAIAFFVLGGLDFSRRAWEISRGREGAEEVDAAMTQLRGLLARTTPAMAIDEGDRIARVLFEGHEHRLTFVTLSEATAFPGGSMRVRLYWDNASDARGRGTLMLRTAVYRSNPRLVVDAQPIVLVRDVVRLSLRYFGVIETGRAPQWLSDWPSLRGTPQLVLVQVEVATNGRPLHRVLQVPLRVAAAN